MDKQKPSGEKKARGKSDPLREVLEGLVCPFMEEAGVDGGEDFEPVRIHETGGGPLLEAMVGGGFVFMVDPYAIDGQRTLLRISMLLGYFADNAPYTALLLGRLLGPGALQIRADSGLVDEGRMSMGLDLVVRRDDEPLVRMHLDNMARMGMELEWWFPMWMPVRVSWQAFLGAEIAWDELPHGDLQEYLDYAMQAPPSERTPRTLLLLAQGLGEWKTVLRLMREHPEELPVSEFAPLKAMAHRECRQWLKAIRAAEEGGIEDGKYPEGPWLSPSYLHALIEVGEEIEALRLLGRHPDEEGEPGFYGWLRGLALHRAGDKEGAAEAFGRYFQEWPEDMIARGMTIRLLENGE